MKISAIAKFLVHNIVMGKVTYLKVMNCKSVKESEAKNENPTLAAQIDDYIKQEGLENEIDKTA